MARPDLPSARSPRDRLARAQLLRAAAEAEERAAIEDALEAAGGLVSRAAGILNVTEGWLTGRVRPGRRLAAVGERARVRRRESGYARGRPRSEPPPGGAK